MHNGVDITILPDSFFCLILLQNFVGEPFCVSKSSWYRKGFIDKSGGGRGVTIRNHKNTWHDRASSLEPIVSEP